MNTMIVTTIAAVVLALPLSFTDVGNAVAQGADGCVSARQAQQAVEAGEILELPDAARRAGVDQKYIDNQAQLCDVDGSPHWIVNMMNESGDSTRVVLNAQGD
jgi:hypothetical protein